MINKTYILHVYLSICLVINGVIILYWYDINTTRLHIQISLYILISIFLTIVIQVFKEHTLIILVYIFMVLYPLGSLRDSSVTAKVAYTDWDTGFRWSQSWPDPWAAIEFHIMWPRLEREFPAEIRVLSSACPDDFVIEANSVILDTFNHVKFLGYFSLNESKSWIIPISNTLFDNYDVIKIRIKPQNWNKSCSIVMNKFIKTSSLIASNIYIYYEEYGTVNIVNFTKKNNKGVLVAQIWNPKF